MRKLFGNDNGHTSFIEMLAPLLFIGIVILIIGALSYLSGRSSLGLIIILAGLVAVALGYIARRGGHF
jgi:hypothetical protein